MPGACRIVHWQHLPVGPVRRRRGNYSLFDISAHGLIQTYAIFPLCEKYGVKLYADVSLSNIHRTFDDPTRGKGVETPEATARFIANLENMSNLTGIVLDSKPFNIARPK